MKPLFETLIITTAAALFGTTPHITNCQQANNKIYKLFEQNIFSLHDCYNLKNTFIEIYCFSRQRASL